jgi:hypothetical protein
MSPEQVQGKAVDHRSDVFSLGILLYEMATGDRPFQGDTSAELASSILRDTPLSVTERKAHLPRDLGKLLRRCLEKEPRKRFQSTADLANELEELKSEVESGEAVSAGPIRKPAVPAVRNKWLWAAIALLAMGLGAVSWLRLRPPEAREPPPRPVPLTSFEGLERDPALSPNGDQVAFVWNGGPDGHYHLYVKLIEGGEPLQLTKAPADDFSPAWSPDGAEIAFLREVEGGHDVLAVSALGGSERPLSTAVVTPHPVFGRALTRGLDWSPDGRLLAMVDTGSPDEPAGIFLLSRENG